ncbi:ABC transporter permease [Spirosoma agri]|nr:ABC transporter permease [Spirosoma agri]
MVRDSIDSMTTDTDLLTFSDLLFINRLLWIGLALGMLAQAEAHFSFDTFRNDQAARASTTDKPADPVVNAYAVPAVRLRFDWRARWRTTLHLARLEFVNLERQPSFQITTGLLVVLAVLLATVFTVNPDFPELPITSRMTALRLPMGLFIGLFLVLMTGELIFTERTTGFWPIYDALPQPDSVLFVSKLLVLAGSAIILTFVLFLTGIGIQLGQGFYRIDWGQYASDLLLDGFMRYCQLIALASLVAVLTNNRVICHLVNVFIFLTLTLVYQFGAHADFTCLYSFLPGSSRYSELIGYGANMPVRPTVHLIWWGVAGLLVIGSVLGWNRGLPDSLPLRFKQWSSRFSWCYGLVSLFLVLFVLFFSLQL